MNKLSYWIIIYALVFASILAIILRLTAGMLPEGSMLLSIIGWIIEVCSFVGSLFINALKMIIVPLVITSIISSIASLRKVESFGRLGAKTVAFYSATTIIATLVGLLCVNIVAPGLENGVANQDIKEAIFNEALLNEESIAEEIKDAEAYTVVPSSEMIKTLFRQMLPVNIVNAASDNGQVLGLITFSIVFGLALSRIPNRDSALLTRLIVSLHEAVILLTTQIMKAAPIGVFALIMSVIYNSGGAIFLKLGKYFFTVVMALGLHAVIVMPLIIYAFAGVNPLRHIMAMKTALITAFSTASSAATIPSTLEAVQEEAGVSSKVANFTIPLGSTVNMNGTSLYECISVIFIAQVMGVNLNITAQFGIVVAALMASVGVAGIPSASLVAIMLILKSSNIPSSEAVFAALLAVDRPLDMLRTAVNVFGDSCSAVVIAHSEGETIYPVEEEETFIVS